MKDPYRSKSWTMYIRIGWKLKPGIKEYFPCEDCNERGYFTCSFDDDEDHFFHNRTTCSKCKGVGKIRNPEVEEMPEVSQVIKNHMVGKFHEFFRRMDEKRNKLKPR